MKIIESGGIDYMKKDYYLGPNGETCLTLEDLAAAKKAYWEQQFIPKGLKDVTYLSAGEIEHVLLDMPMVSNKYLDI